MNCASCNHFAPLATNTNFISLEQVEKDMNLLNKFNSIIGKLTIIGGEILLHPHLEDIIHVCSKTFNDKLKIITNGTIKDRLLKLKETIIKLNVELVITEYPFKEDWKEYYNNLSELFPFATFYKYRIEHGFISEQLSYADCYTDNKKILSCDKRYKCLQYVNGRLYICHYAAFLPYLEKITTCAFDNKDSYIDLNNSNCTNVINWVNSNIPAICNHCLYVKKSYDELNKTGWHKSEKNPKEWIN